jgi:hypothetical protein
VLVAPCRPRLYRSAMPIPSTIADLSPVAASNSPAGSDPPTEGDNFLRALSAIIRVEHDNFATAASAGVGAGMMAYNATLSYSAGTVGAKLKDTVSVKDAPYLATGDGVTDDLAAIQAAIDAGYGTILIPAGSYRTTGKILLDNVGQRLVGAGRNSTTIFADFQGGAVIEINQGRCGVTDMAISSLSGSARRLASPEGVTPPSVNVDGLSSDRGIFLNEVGLMTYVHVIRVDIINQPGDGLNMAGHGAGTIIDQVGISACGGHGMYFDDGDRDGTAKTRCGIVEVRDCVVQTCWGHGIALASDTASATTVYRFNIHNCDVFGNCLGDGGTDQPAFLSAVKSAIAVRAQNTRIAQCGLTDNNGIVITNGVDLVLESNRYVTCADRAVLINTSCSRIKIINPYCTSAPSVAGFRVMSGCDNVSIDGLVESEYSTIIDAESECLLWINNKRVFTIPGTNTLWYADESKEATIASAVCNINSGIVRMKGEGDLVDTVNQVRISSTTNIPDDYRFVICNFNAYNITLADLTVGGSANLQMQGTAAVLEPGESMAFVMRTNVAYAIGREVP